MNVKELLKQFVFFAFLMMPVLAQAAGLEAGTTVMTTIKTWAYGALGVGAFIFLIYKVIQAMMDSIGWMQVVIALGWVALAGGILVAGETAWAVWGS